ncbi:hypothetical protein Tco_1407782 [Tanacetum coccineum]
MTLLNQDLFYLRHANSGSKKNTLSLHKYPTVPFPENDFEELTTRWVSKCIRRFNLYARYSVKHWKNLWAKQHYIRRQEKQKDKPKEVYSDSNLVEVIRTSYELGHEHKFITEIVMVKKYDEDLKYGYADLSPTDAYAEYLEFYEEYIKDWLKHRYQIRR